MDEAIALHEPMMQFLQQDMFESASLPDSVNELSASITLAESVS